MQVYYNNTWYWVCADQWDKHDADVACKMMDFDGSLSTNSERQEKKPKETWAWLTNIQCTGNESSLLLCGYDSSLLSQGCKTKRLAGVKCRKTQGKYFYIM